MTYSYDAAGRPLARGGAWSAGYGWDAAGNLQLLTWPDGTQATFVYDPLNRQKAACAGNAPGCSGATSYGAMTYDAIGRRQTLTFHDGSTQTWTYDNADRVASIAHVFPNDTADNVTFGYGYDPADRETSRTLTNASYAYVPAAKSTPYAAANALNQYPSVAGYAYSYWPEGGLEQSDTVQANEDELGKLTLAYITKTPGTVDPNNFEFMIVDALGHLYGHAHQGAANDTHPFIYHSTDGLRPETALEWQCQQTGAATPVCSGTGTGTRRYVLGPDPDERWAFLDTNGTIDSPHTDRQGNLIALTNAAIVSQKYAYDPYGQSTAPASDSGPGSASYLYRYTGQRLDPSTGLYDYKARDYSPVLGRFLQPDPAGLDQGPNLYEYVGNEPVGAEDPTGLQCDQLLACSSSPGPASDAPTGDSAKRGQEPQSSAPALQFANSLSAARLTFGTTGKLIVGEEIIGGGPEDPVADAAAAVTAAGGLATAGWQIAGPLLKKAMGEINGIISRDLGPNGEQYALVASTLGVYPNVRGGTTKLNAGDVWRYGETISSSRYSQASLSAARLTYVVQYRGTQIGAKIAEKVQLYNYYNKYGTLPPGNKIFW